VLRVVTQARAAIAVVRAFIAAGLAAVIERNASAVRAAVAATAAVIAGTSATIGHTLVGRANSADAAQRTAVGTRRAGAARVRTDADVGDAARVRVARPGAALRAALTRLAHG